jgi:DNA-binding response OmpR family regulator
MLMAKVLLVSDDRDGAWIWSQLLTQKGLDVVTVSSALEALERREEDNAFDLYIIDEYTSQLDSVELTRQLRSGTSIPILLLIANNDEPKALEAYEAGVDECVTKPLGPRLFVAKVRAWLRRSATIPRQMLSSFQVGDLQLDPVQGQLVKADGSTLKLTNLEFRLLHLLMSNPVQIIETSTIINRVWGYNGEEDTNVLKNVVYRLRRKIEQNPSEPRYIHSIAGEGYMFIPHEPVQKSSPASLESVS